MKELFRNRFFYVSVLLAALLAGQVYGIVSAQTYTGPSAPPPAANVAEPLHTGSSAQYKAGSFGIGTASNNVLLSLASNVRQLLFTEGALNAAIKLDPTTGKLMFRHSGGSFQDIGTGGGAGWEVAGADIANTNTGSVIINQDLLLDGAIKTQDFVPTSLRPYTTSGYCNVTTGVATDAPFCGAGYEETARTVTECVKSGGGGDVLTPAFLVPLVNSANAATDNTYVNSRTCTPASAGSVLTLDRVTFPDYDTVKVNGSLNAPKGLTGYPAYTSGASVCFDDSMAYRYHTDGDLSYIEFGGTGPTGDWNRNCGGAPTSPRWRWSKTSGNSMLLCTVALSDYNRLSGGWVTLNVCSNVSRSLADGAVVYLFPGIDKQAGVGSGYLNYRLESYPYTLENWE